MCKKTENPRFSWLLFVACVLCEKRKAEKRISIFISIFHFGTCGRPNRKLRSSDYPIQQLLANCQVTFRCLSCCSARCLSSYCGVAGRGCRHSAIGIWHLAFGIWHLAFGIWPFGHLAIWPFLTQAPRSQEANRRR